MKIGKREISLKGYHFNKGIISKCNQISLMLVDETDVYMNPKLNNLDYIGEIQLRESEDINISFGVNNINYDEDGEERIKLLRKTAENLLETKLDIIDTMLSHTYYSKSENAYSKIINKLKHNNIPLVEGDEFTFDPEGLTAIDEFKYTEFINGSELSLKRPKRKIRERKI